MNGLQPGLAPPGQMAAKATATRPRAGVFVPPAEIPLRLLLSRSRDRFVQARDDAGRWDEQDHLHLPAWVPVPVSVAHLIVAARKGGRLLLQLDDALRLAQVCKAFNSLVHSKPFSEVLFHSLFADLPESDSLTAGPCATHLSTFHSKDGATQGTGLRATRDIAEGTEVGVYQGVCRTTVAEDARNVFLFRIAPVPVGTDTDREGNEHKAHFHPRCDLFGDLPPFRRVLSGRPSWPLYRTNQPQLQGDDDFWYRRVWAEIERDE
eukprot:CAMPEP_0173465612 /NCGR_PEP_ID=MMETSP1357-20121228/71950_1 /TAXON_ID=77926 /ORGANISM="Hemiselmis rufescens, Strain PCC563" /LENGTH=263 /DNA_ID=CAMNT_0014433605 /DNA_START=45 /DNA_END=833 /DNA_ORIENTATION=+